MKKSFSTFLLSLLMLTACDPAHDLILENKSNSDIEMIFYPDLWERFTKNKIITKIKGYEWSTK